jgi:hypothetical protein
MRTVQIFAKGASLTGAILFAIPALAQQTGSAPEPLPAQPPANANPAVDPYSLIPQSPPETVPRPVTQPRPVQPAPPPPAAPPKVSKTEANVEQIRLGIRLYEAKTVALRDPAIQAQIAWAEAAKTDEGKRERLVTYFKMLFARVVKVDPTLKTLADTSQTIAIAGVVQANIKKSLPIERN